MLDYYAKGNDLKTRDKQIPFTEFYNDGINKEIDLRSEYKRCKQEGFEQKNKNTFSLCFYPWILDAASKTDILKYESNDLHNEQIDQELVNMFIGGLMNPDVNQSDYKPSFEIKVRRQELVEDTLNCLVKGNVNLKKKLKVKFVNEPAQDEGGVQKEFYQLLIKELFNTEYTMFYELKESNILWFNGSTFESNLKFELLGILMGMAIYNGVLLDIHFPHACYKMLLDQTPDLEDLKEYSPQLGKSLEFIVNY